MRADLLKKLQRDGEFREKKEQQKRESDMADKKLYYAGIGSRQTPEYVLDLMEQLARRLRKDDFILRSGHAPGADQAFERGAGAAAQIFLPWPTFEQDVEFASEVDYLGVNVLLPWVINAPQELAYEAAEYVHPVWENLKPGARKLHARNVHQILGPDLARPTPVEFVICWTPDAQIKGGTATAIRIAENRDIPVHNLADEETYDWAFEWAWEEGFHEGGLIHDHTEHSSLDGLG